MKIHRIYAIFLRYVMLLKSSPQRIFQIFIWGGLDIILWGFLTKYLNQVGGNTFSFVSVLLGAVILIDFIARTQQGTSTPALEDIWSNNLLNYFASPLRISEYILGLISASTLTSAFSIIGMILLARIIFGFSLLSLGIPLAGFLATLFLFGISLGIIGVSIVLRFGPSGEWYIWPMTMLLSPFMGVFYPISVLPSWMQITSHLLPPSYVFEGMRSIVFTGSFDATTLFMGLSLSLFYIALTQFIFFRVYRSVVKSGLLTRYSAESA